MNMFPNSFDSAPKVEDWFSFKENGKVRMVSGKVEIGQGINTAFMQIAAEELDINPDRIQLSAGNTKDKLDGGCTSGSQSCLLYTSPSPRDGLLSRMPSSA